MRSLRLARIAAEAEALRLRRMVQRTVTRLTLGLVALFFLCFAVSMFHVGVWFWLRGPIGWEPQTAGLAMAGFDFAIAVVLALIAALSGPGRVEREALDVRRRAWESALSGLALSAILAPTLRLGVNLMRRRRGR